MWNPKEIPLLRSRASELRVTRLTHVLRPVPLCGTVSRSKPSADPYSPPNHTTPASIVNRQS